MGRSDGLGPIFFLQISLGIYFAIEGVNRIQSKGMDLVIAIVLLVAGIFLVLSLFSPIGGNLTPILYIAVIVIWAFFIIQNNFMNNFKFSLSWLSSLAWKVALLSGLWLVSRKDM